MIPRGIRNNNPGNLKRGTDDWRGLSAEQHDPDFYTFDSAVWGVRAMARILLNYQRKHHLSTVAQIISRWAPQSENDTAAYIKAVSGTMHIMSDAPMDLTDRCTMFLLLEAIIRQENGEQPYSGNIIHLAIDSALMG